MKQKVTCTKKGSVWKAHRSWKLTKEERLAFAMVLVVAGYVTIRVLLG